jgi:hypothetical protein
MASNRVGSTAIEGEFGPDLLGRWNGPEGHDPTVGGAFDGDGGAGDGHDVFGLPVSGSQGVPADDPVP